MGIALIRVWVSFDTPDRLVIRLIASDAGVHYPLGVASTISGATALLEAWLEGLTRREHALGAASRTGLAPGTDESP